MDGSEGTILLGIANRLCEVPNCDESVRPAQKVCDPCRKRFIEETGFREWLLRLGCIPD